MEENTPNHFIAQAITEDLASGRSENILTRFPPEPNGYLHIGHAKAISISFEMAKAFGGKMNLRMDDTNPDKEDAEFVEAIQEDMRWLGYDWDHYCYASDHFGKLYGFAQDLVRKGLAYVDDQSGEEMSHTRGSLTDAGQDSPYRSRSSEENLDLLARMRAGEFENGEKVLRAKIDMASPNLNMRDPVLYRVKRVHHDRTGDDWPIYPTYDFAHGQSDSIEGITHSLCSLEFEDHRPLYDWLIEKLEIFPSRQIEFARLSLPYTVTSKRKLRQLVEEGHVDGWDDPRMPTLRGMRRRGFRPSAIHAFLERTGVTKFPGTTEYELLEFCVRQDLETSADRRMVVLDPLKVVIKNFTEGETEWYPGPNHPADESRGTRDVPLTREIYIDRADFMEDPPKKFFRLGPGREVRLRYACYITCTDVVKDAEGTVTELHAEFDPESRGASTPDNRRVKGTIHWVSATENRPVEVRLYEKLFSTTDPEDTGEGGSFLKNLNPDSLKTVQAFGEPAIDKTEAGAPIQFERKGYFALDGQSTDERIILNRTVSLKDSWSKKQAAK